MKVCEVCYQLDQFRYQLEASRLPSQADQLIQQNSLSVDDNECLCLYIYIYIYIYGEFNKLPDFFVKGFKIVIDS